MPRPARTFCVDTCGKATIEVARDSRMRKQVLITSREGKWPHI
jgi:hypothetical protein